MAGVKHQEFAGMSVSSTICTKLALPVWAKPRFKMETLPEDMREAVVQLRKDLRTFQVADRNYSNSGHDFSGPWVWREHYDLLLQSHEVLCDCITDDTPLARAVLDWGNRIVPPPCRQAMTFWTPIPDISAEFQPLAQRFFEVRAREAMAKWAFWSRYPSGHNLKDDNLNDFQTKHEELCEASNAWTTTYTAVSTAWAQTAGDRELARRAVQHLCTEDVLDMPYLRRHVADWKPYEDWPVLRRCPLPCETCNRILDPSIRWEDA